MPNHVHGILILHSVDGKQASLSRIISAYKGAVTRTARKKHLVNANRPVWQRSFHDRIIRNQREYEYIAGYIQTNPSRWEADSLNI